MRAFSDLESIKEHYKEEDISHIGEQYVVSIIDVIQALSENPGIGRKVSEFDEEKIRELVHSPFRIVYLIEKSSVHIVRVWRSERVLVLPEHKI